MKPLDFSPGEELAIIDEAMLREALAAFEPPVVLSSVDWAESNISLPEESNAEPGPLKLTSYQRGILEAFDDPRTETVVAKMASQTGKSLVLDIALLSQIAQAPGPMLLVHPTTSKATSYVADRLNPLIIKTPAISDIVTKSTLSSKTFLGGSLNVASSFIPEDLAARAIKLLVLDEVDRFARSAGTEGDPVALAIKRTRTYRNSKRIIASTPTQKGASRVEDWYLRGTQERFAIPCPDCGSLQVPGFENLKWKPGKPQTAHLTCTDCAHQITERERLKAVDLGCWLAFNPNPEPGVRSFHATELVSKFSSLASVAKQAEDAVTSEQKKTFQNTVLAEVFDLHAEAFVDPATLQARAIKLVAPFPKDIEFVTAGVDVQGNRLEVLYLAHGTSGQKWVIDRDVIAGDTSSEQPWYVLADRLNNAVFRIEDGRNLPLSRTFVDSGHAAHRVYAFATSNPNVTAIKGVGGWDRQLVAFGKRILGPIRLMLLGVDNLKLAVAKCLAKTELGPGYIHLPAHLDTEFYDQLGAERIETAFNNRGFARHVWVKDPSAANEALDCLAYALAAGEIVTKPARPLGSKPAKTVAQLAKELNEASNAKPSQDQDDNVLAFRKVN